MKLFLCGVSVLACVAVLAAPPLVTPTAESWPDTLTLANGAIVRCRIRTASPISLLIDYPRPGPGQQPVLTRDVPWSKIKSAEFAMDEEFHHLVAATDPVKDTPRLAAQWKTLAPLIGRPHHPAGDLGLTLARLSLEHPEPSARVRGLGVCQAVATDDWKPARAHQARWLQIQILSALGRQDEAVHEARRLANETTITPEAAMPAHVMIAEADFASLRKLQEENPRWDVDDVVRPDREALFHQALDAALKPSLFHGALEDPASQGLWIAVQLLEFDHQLPAAADAARDLTLLYPASAHASEATAFLKRHRLPLDPAEAPAEPPPPAIATATGHPPPQHTGDEPIVHRRARYADTTTGADRNNSRAPPVPASPPNP